MADLASFPLFFGIIAFSYEGNTTTYTFYRQCGVAEHPFINEGGEIVHKTHVCCYRNVYPDLNIDLCIDIRGNLQFDLTMKAYGNSTQDMITLNLKPGTLTSFVQIFYVFAIGGSYPLQMLPTVNLIEESELFKQLPSCFIPNVTIKTNF